MANGGWGSLETAARVRDIIKNGIARATDGIDRKLIGRCINVDLPSLTAQVWFPGDDAPVKVKLFSSVIPASWEQKGFPTVSSSGTNGYGGMVSVEDFNGSLYITDVLTGGVINPTTNGVAPVDSNGNPGNLGYTVLSVSTKQSVNVPVDGCVTFGPFRRVAPNTTSPMGGAIRILVENSKGTIADGPTNSVGTAALYEVNVSAYGQYNLGTERGTISSDLPTYSSDYMDALPRFVRLLPEQFQHMYGSLDGLDDFDLEMGVQRTVQGGATTQNPSYEFWFRIINRRFAAHDMDYTITFTGSMLQTAIGIDNKFTTSIQTIADPSGGYLGFHQARNGLFSMENVSWSFPFRVIDNFAGTATATLGSNYQKYPWIGNAALTRNNRGQIRLTAANQEVRTDLSRTFYGTDNYAEFAVSAVALGQPIKAGVKYNKNSTTSFFWAAIHLNVGGTVSYSIVKRVSGTDTVLQTGTVSYQGVGLTYAANTKLALHVKYFPGGTHTVSIWNLATQVEALADKYTYATDATYPGRNPITPSTSGTVAGLIVSQATGGTNTYPVDVYCYYFESIQNPGGNDTATGQPEAGDRFAMWDTGPWRSSVLRYGELLQRTITLPDTFVWSGTNLKWNGNILLGGVGPNRNGLWGGAAYISMPKSITAFNWYIPTFTSDDGTPIEVDNSTGIPLAPGTGLWVGVRPGSRYQDLKPYLFLVNDFSMDRKPNFDLPEWAVLIAYRPSTGNYLIAGNGQEIYVADGMENGAWGLFSGTTTENAGAYTNMGSPASTTLSKIRTGTRLVLEMSGTFQSSVTTTGGQFGIRINGVDYDVACTPAPLVAANASITYHGSRILAASTVPAGLAYTVQGRMKRLAGAGTITTAATDQVSINVREIP